jgi:hypothetical protein
MSVLGMRSSGFSGLGCTFPTCPVTRRVKPRTGLSRPAPISRQIRSEPVAVLSSTVEEMRYSASPMALPPTPVAIQSLTAGGCVSPQHSHQKLPMIAVGRDAQ